ncbi:MAG: peptidase, partial [Gemmatimonadetes bacterium]|nr:peptidase [Gemmatimonadota bacterium]
MTIPGILARPLAAFVLVGTLAHPPALARHVRAATPPTAPCDAAQNRYCSEIERLMKDPRVRQALDAVAHDTARVRRELIELTEIASPPFKEQARAARYLAMLRDAGADSAWIDQEGNAIALRRGHLRNRLVVLEGHLDTVFPEGTDVKVKVRGDTLAAPGIGDDTRGLVTVLSALRAVNAAGLRTDADLLFAGTVGEEGLGDLRGTKHLFRAGAPKIDAYIAVEPGENGIAVTGIGSKRYRVTFKGPGGHSWGAFGTANPIHALGRAITMFDQRADQLTKSGPRTSYNVGRIGGGTSVNSVPFEAWAEVDMRSENDSSLAAVDRALQAAVQQALAEQNAVARRGAKLTVDMKLVGERPSGST